MVGDEEEGVGRDVVHGVDAIWGDRGRQGREALRSTGAALEIRRLAQATDVSLAHLPLDRRTTAIGGGVRPSDVDLPCGLPAGAPLLQQPWDRRDRGAIVAQSFGLQAGDHGLRGYQAHRPAPTADDLDLHRDAPPQDHEWQGRAVRVLQPLDPAALQAGAPHGGLHLIDLERA